MKSDQSNLFKPSQISWLMSLSISFHVDAVQAIGKIPVSSYLTDRVDFATFSGHKFHAVRGVGFVYKKAGKKITPLLTGGGQEKRFSFND